MKKLLLSAVMVALTTMGIGAQGLKFTPRYAAQQREARKARIEKIEAEKNKDLQPKGSLIGEYTEIVSEDNDDDTRYRYVYSYDNNNMRVSEAIYQTKKENDVWGTETFFTLGTYTYGYDTSGRVNLKKVSYEPEPEYGDISSYYIMVTYNNDGTASYTKYVKSDSEYKLSDTWSYYSNGSLASLATDCTDGYDYQAVEYDTNGNVTMFSDSFYNKDVYSGELNDRTVISYTNYDYPDGSWQQNSITTYKYDPEFLVLLEYTHIGTNDGMDNERQVYTYDSFGRIVKAERYGTTDENDVVEPTPDVAEPASVSTKSTATWELSYSESYTYFNDEVYGVGNAWHDVVGLDGPVASFVSTDYTGAEQDNNCNINFNRDSTGKLTGVEYINGEGNYSNPMRITVDADGHITKIDYETSFYYAYTWEGEYIATSKVVDGSWYETSTHEYGDNWHRAKAIEYDDNSSWCIIEVSKTDTKLHAFERHYNNGVESTDSYDRNEFIIETQQEDVVFVRPNISKDLDGMVVQQPITASKAGRVACVVYNVSADGIYEYQYEYVLNTPVVPNMLKGVDDYYGEDLGIPIYYSVERDGENVVCSNFEGLPVFVLNGNRLVKEYVYRDEQLDMGGSSGSVELPGVEVSAKSITIPAGQAYDEITYVYDNEGLLVGKNVATVDSKGTTTEETSIEYKYVAAGVETIEVDAAPKAILNGRTLGFSGNEEFTIYTVDGRVIASSTTSFTLPATGIYIIAVNGQSFKLHVK